MSLSGSALERTHECLASTILPQFPHTGVEAEHGTENHSKAEREDLPDGIREVVTSLPDVQKETSFVLDTKNRTSRIVQGHRNYGQLAWYEIGTTPDVWSASGDGFPGTVLDFKSRKRVQSASANWQIRSQVCAVAAHSGATRLRAGIAYLNDSYIDWAEFGPIELNAAWADLFELCDRVRQIKAVHIENPTAAIAGRRGDWCSYCPCLLSCPAQKQALTAFRGIADIGAMVSSATDAELEDARLAKSSLESMLKQFDQALRQRAEVAPIQLRNGKKLSMVESSRTSDDIYLMKEALRHQGIDPEKFKKTSTYKSLRETKG